MCPSVPERVSHRHGGIERLCQHCGMARSQLGSKCFEAALFRESWDLCHSVASLSATARGDNDQRSEPK